MPITYNEWFNRSFPADTNAVASSNATPAPGAVSLSGSGASALPKFVPNIVYLDVYGRPMHPDEFQANKRLWSGTTWADPYGQLNIFDERGNLTEEAIAAGYTPDLVWQPDYPRTNALNLASTNLPNLYRGTNVYHGTNVYKMKR